MTPEEQEALENLFYSMAEASEAKAKKANSFKRVAWCLMLLQVALWAWAYMDNNYPIEILFISFILALLSWIFVKMAR